MHITNWPCRMKELFNANGYYKKFNVKMFFLLPFFGIDNQNNKLKALKGCH